MSITFSNKPGRLPRQKGKKEMKNFEKFESELKKYEYNFGVSKEGKPIPCAKNNRCNNADCCQNCIFGTNPNLTCFQYKMDWLYCEYDEPQPKLTKAEDEFLRAIEDKDSEIARNGDGKLYLFIGGSAIELQNKLFPFITWEGGKVWSIEELKGLEVEDSPHCFSF